MEEKLSVDKSIRSKTLYGFYSAKCATLHGCCVYKRPDGSYINVTSVSKSATASGTSWDDVVFVGEVTECVTPNMQSVVMILNETKYWDKINNEK
jgi:hypothetical protein